MFPLLFMPFNSDSQEYLENLPVSYDLKSSQSGGQGAMNITITEKRRIGREPLYSVTINSVKVMADMTVTQSEVGEVSAGLTTKSWTTRRVMKLASGERETITRHVRNNGTHYTIENLFGDTLTSIEERAQEKQDKKDKKKIKQQHLKGDNKQISNNRNENQISISAENLENFLSLPAAAILEKLFAQKKCSLNIKDLKTLNDSGEVIKVSYDSELKESCLEITKMHTNEDHSENCMKTVMDFAGNILTCNYDEARWVREEKAKNSVLEFPSTLRLSLYQEGRLERLIRQQNYRKDNPHMSEVFKDLLQHLLMTKPQNPILAMKEYLRENS